MRRLGGFPGFHTLRLRRRQSGFPEGALCLLALVVCGCAGILSGPRVDTSGQDGQAWQALFEGYHEKAAAHLQGALAEPRGPSALALFGAGSLAYERGDSEAALAHYIDLLAAAVDGSAGDRLLASGAAARLPRLLMESPSPRAAENRLLSLPRERLPWRVQYLLATLAQDIAGRRADAVLAEEQARRSGCAFDLRLTDEAGRLPYLDLASEVVRVLPSPRTLQRVGCRFSTPALEAQPGVRVLRARIDVRGPHWIVLDSGGPALLRVDGGAWHHHADSPEATGARWSALRVELGRGSHEIELRMGSHGGALNLGLLLAPATGPDPTWKWQGGRPLDNAVFGLAFTMAAYLAGEVDDELAGAAELSSMASFSLGHVLAARVAEVDVTRPHEMNRDRARGLYLKATARDVRLARAWADVSRIELDDDRPREACEHAEKARSAAPRWWPASLQLFETLRARGLEIEADSALGKALALVQQGGGGCLAIERALRRARELAQSAEVKRLTELLLACDARSDLAVNVLRDRGDKPAALTALQRTLPTSEEPLQVRSDMAALRMEQGDAAGAAAALRPLIDWSPLDAQLRVRLADALLAMGATEEATTVLTEAMHRLPVHTSIRDAARATGLSLPLDEFRIDGGQVIRDFLASGHRYDAPGVVVLDRLVDRVFRNGARASLTHTITLVLSKEGIERAGEIAIPAGAEILTVRTRKADGTIREAQEIAGKPSISASDLSVGDFVEWETLELRQPSEVYAPGFLGDRFYFQSAEAPLDRSEYLLVVPFDLPVDLDRRAGAPEPVLISGPAGTRVLRMAGRQFPQIFPERSSVVAEDWVPSVRASSGAGLVAWSRFWADRMHTVTRASPELRDVARQIVAEAKRTSQDPAEAIVAWVNQHIEPEATLFEPATVTLARGQGNRAALVMALARVLSVRAELMLVRSLGRAPAAAPLCAQELDDFSESVVRLVRADGGVRFFNPRLRRAPFGYLSPELAGAPGFVLGDDGLLLARSAIRDGRHVTMKMQLDKEGAAAVSVNEELTGWPAVEWNELLQRVGRDRTKLRQEFEQRWLSLHFPGAELGELTTQESQNGGRQIHYTMTSPRMATREGDVLWMSPSFFHSQPGRRYFTEAQRRTPLQLGYEPPLVLEADVLLPVGARVLDLGSSGAVDLAGIRFSEERMVQVDGQGPGSASAHLYLRRRWELPLARIAPERYQEIAKKLRQVDALERSALRIEVRR